MSGGVRWDLLQSPDFAGSFMRSFEQGQRIGEAINQRKEQRELKKALAAIAANPEDQNALAAVFQSNPQLGATLMDRAESRAFNRDMGEYLTGGGVQNALLGFGQSRPQQAPQAPVNALAAAVQTPMAPDASFKEAFAPWSAQQPAPAPAPAAPAAGPAPAGDNPFAFLGQPQTGRDRAFLAMLKRDPIKALKIDSELRKTFLDRLDGEQKFYAHAVDALSRANDDASWQAGLQRLAPMVQALGGDLLAHVPATYPGEEAVNALLEEALPIKERLDLFLREANIDADNARADRNTDSLIADRQGRRAEQVRHNRASESNVRRGQDKRPRSASRSGSQRQQVVKVSTVAEAQALKPGTLYKTPDGTVRER